MEKIGIYYRVSTQEQEKEESIETQKNVIEKIYQDRNVVKRYSDNGFSGAILERPALSELRDDVKNGKINIVAVYSLARLSRKTKYLLQLLDEFEQYNIELEVKGEKTKNNNTGTLSLTIISAAYQFQREEIIEDMRAGKYRKVEKGIMIGYSPPYGYKLFRRNPIDGTVAHFEINPKEAYGVKQAFKTYLEKQSIRQTIKKLADLKIFARNGKPFSPKTLKRMLSNEIYIGNYYYGKSYPYGEKNHRGQRNGRKFRPKSEWKLIKMPKIALIDKAVFNKIQEILDYRKKHFLKETKYQYLCQGLVRCLKCGRVYTAKPTAKPYKSKRYIAYFCSSNVAKLIGQPRCKSRQMSQNKLESAVWEYVKNLISYPDKVKKAVRLLREKREEKRDSNKRIYDVLMAEKMKIKMKKSKFLKLYGDDKYLKEDLDKEIEELNSQEKLFVKQIDEVVEELKQNDKTEVIEREIEESCLSYQRKINNPSFELKKMIVRKWVKEINITDEGNIIIKVRIPEINRKKFYPPLATTTPITSLAPDSSSFVAHSSIVEPVV